MKHTHLTGPKMSTRYSEWACNDTQNRVLYGV